MTDYLAHAQRQAYDGNYEVSIRNLVLAIQAQNKELEELRKQNVILNQEIETKLVDVIKRVKALEGIE